MIYSTVNQECINIKYLRRAQSTKVRIKSKHGSNSMGSILGMAMKVTFKQGYHEIS